MFVCLQVLTHTCLMLVLECSRLSLILTTVLIIIIIIFI